MNNQIQIFKNEKLNLQARAIQNEDGNISINLEDSGKGLGFIKIDRKNGKEYIRVDMPRIQKYIVEAGFGNEFPNVSKEDYIPESLFYLLAMKANNKVAQEFQKWLAVEVIPQIRKTGGYIPIEAKMSEAEIMARALQISQRTIEQKDKLLKEKEVELVATKGELEDKNRFIGQISASKTSMLVRDVAHLVTKNNIKIGEKRLWMKLREWGLIFKESTKPKQRALEQGLFEVSQFAIQTNHGVTTKATTRVTAKGQVYIINRLLQEGI